MLSNKQLINNIMILFLQLILVLVIFIFGNFNNISDFQFSIIYFVMFVTYLISFITNHTKLNSLIFLFFLTFNLFICGRFFYLILSHILNCSLIDKNSIFTQDYMIHYTPSFMEINFVFLLINIFLVFLLFGYHISNCKTNKNFNQKYTAKAKKIIVLFLFIVFFICTMMHDMTLFYKVMKYGYLALYNNVTSPTIGSRIYIVLFYALFAIIVSMQNKKTIIFASVLMIIYSTLHLILGQRGVFLVTVLTLFWLYTRNVKIKIMSFIFIVLCIYIIFTYLFSLFSLRILETDGGNTIGVDSLLNFIYQQGVSLSVLSYSLSFEKFPTIVYLNWIPAFTHIYRALIESISQHEESFANMISWATNPTLYKKGCGLGFSIIGAIYFLSFKNIIIFAINTFLFGSLIKIIEIKSIHSAFWLGLATTFSMNLFFMPRSDYASSLNAIVYYITIYIILNKIIYIVNKKYFKVIKWN